MKVLIAGGSGFVGMELAGKLGGHDLVIPSRDPEKLGRSGLRGEFPAFPEDLSGLVRAAAPDVVVNLLGIIRETRGAGFERVHEGYTRSLLEGARAAGVKKFIQMSALGAAPDAPSLYHRTKFAAEELVRESGLPYVIFRPSYITGAGQGLRAQLRRLSRIAPFFAAPSDAFLAPVPAADVASCFARAIGDAAVKNEIFELAGDEAISFRELLARESAAAGIKRPVAGLPLKLFFPLLPLFSLFPEPPMTREQYLMASVPSLPSGRFRGVKDLL